MSEDVHYQGILRELKVKCKENFAGRKIKELGIKKDDFYDSNLECLLDNYNNGYVEINDTLYEIETKNSIDQYSGFFEAEKVGKTKIRFNVKYYNGGCGFTEALEDAINNMKDR
jgi:hypothetical protein